MKTYEWIIKIISYVLCGAAVCAGFAVKERNAAYMLDSYTESVQEQKTSQLSGILVRLKSGLARCISDENDREAYAEVSYCCKAASDAVCAVNSKKSSEALRLFFDRVKKVCDTVYESGKAPDQIRRQSVSELYMRLSAAEDMLLSGRMSADELISALSAGLDVPEEAENAKLDRISMSSAEKRAYKLVGKGVRLRSGGIFDERFVFSSDGSCVVLTKKGDPYIKSRTIVEGEEHISKEEAEQIAKERVSELTGASCDAILEDKVFGIYYFTVLCEGKEYPVGVDKTDGSVVFEINRKETT